MRRRLARVLILVCFAASAMRAVAYDVQYTVTDLGTIGGPNVQVTGINSSGQVCGTADGAVSGTGFAYLWTAPGPMMSLGALGSLPTQSNANGINDNSFVVGQSGPEGFVYTPQTGMQGVGFLLSGTYSALEAINNSNVAVGGAVPRGASIADAAIWDPANGLRDLNKMIVNPPSNWAPTDATAISQNGLIAGIGSAGYSALPPPPNQHAFALAGGSLTVIPDPGTFIQPASINSNGDVVGEFFDSQGQHAFIYSAANGTQEIGDPSAPIASANEITDSGLVLGGITLADGSEYGFLYTQAGGMVNLNTLVDLNGWTINDAIGMNQSGQIVCDAVNSSSVLHGFLLTPVPEPTTTALLTGFAAVTAVLQLWLARRRFNWNSSVDCIGQFLGVRPSFATFFPLAVILASGSVAGAATLYTVTDLGTLGGPNVQVYGINSSGQVCENADGAVAGTGYGYFWSAPGPMISLGALGSLPTQSSAYSINDSSWVVGGSNGEGYVWTPKNGMQGVGFLTGGTYSLIESINSSDVAVGGATPAGAGVAHAAIWDPTNGLRDLNSTIVNPPTDWAPTVAIVINNSGMIAGIGYQYTSAIPPSGTEHAFVLQQRHTHRDSRSRLVYAARRHQR